MFEEDFAPRLIQLRTQKGVSARDMSLSIGQNPNYIFSIENGRMLPSMASFFYICEYLKVTPSEFFDLNNSNPQRYSQLCKELKKFDSETLESLAEFIVRVRN